MDHSEQAFADHLLEYMGLTKEKREFAGRLLLLEREDSENVESTTINYGKVSNAFAGKITHSSQCPLVISSKTILRGRFSKLEEENKTIKVELTDYLKQRGIWIPNGEIVQYSSHSYVLEAIEMDEFYYNIHFPVKRIK